jgi:hypothetical protein
MPWSWLFLVACTPEEPVDPCAPGPRPTLEIGTGEQAFEPMPAALTLVHGPQGGFHVVLAFEATGLDGELVGGEVTGAIDGAVVATSAPWLELACNPDTDTLQAWGVLLIYSDGQAGDPTPEALDGQDTEVVATLTDAEGRSVTGVASTRIVDPLVE